MDSATLTVPNVLGSNTRFVEEFYSTVDSASRAEQYVLDLASVRFVRVYGVIALVIAARRLAARSERPVLIQNIPDELHSYLHRMNFFQVGDAWLCAAEDLSKEWARNPQTPNLLELTVIAGPEDVGAAIARMELVFSRWLKISNLRNLLSAVSELCSNLYQHSRDRYGCVLVQKYSSFVRDRVVVNMAVGDMGQGIRGSLESQHGRIGEDPLDYLYKAMQGMSARSSGRGGIGLRLVERIVAAEGGYLWLRSETAAILSRGPGTVQGLHDLSFCPGTQVAVELHAPLRI